MSMSTRSRARSLVAGVVTALGVLATVAPVEATPNKVTRADLEAKGYKCERRGIGGWRCAKLGDVWLCPNNPLEECTEFDFDF